MKVISKTVFYILGMALVTFAAGASPQLPRFQEYREPISHLKNGAKPIIISERDREYKTRVNEASTQSPNFAGHYVLSSFGCGSACIMSFALDKKTGKVAWLPFTVCCWDNADSDFEPIAFRKNSRLIVVTGSRNEQGKGIYYYEFQQGEFVLIRQVEQ